MKCSIILEAQDIPNNTLVTPVTGSKKYYLRKNGVKLYADDGVKVFAEDFLVLQSDEGLRAISKDKKLKVDFDCLEDAARFIWNLGENEYPMLPR